MAKSPAKKPAKQNTTAPAPKSGGKKPASKGRK